MKTLNIAESYMINGGCTFGGCVKSLTNDTEVNSLEGAGAALSATLGCGFAAAVTVVYGAIACGVVGAGIGLFAGRSIAEKALGGIAGGFIGGYLGKVGIEYAIT
jgi:hypothetical protein